jgi:hypothetical protein
MIKNYTFKSSIYSGDLIYVLSSIKHICEKNNTKAEIYLWLDRPCKSYDGAVHPYGNVGVNRYALDMLKPLVESQPYVACLKEWRGEEVKTDLDDIRGHIQVPTMPYGSITRWPGYAWPDMQTDLSMAWMWDFKPTPGGLGAGYPPMEVFKKREASAAHGKILINRTSRYQNGMIHYWFLKEYAKDLVFTGLPEEHAEFCRQWEIDIPLLKVQNFLELAIALKSCRYFIGNQSMCFALAEAMKIPRLLEVCPYAPNVIPCGRDGYDFLHQFAVEWMVKDVESPLNKL